MDVQAQLDVVPDPTPVGLHEGRIYIFSRGTKSKSNLLAQEFSLRDTSSTHVGIGYYQDQRFFIYNVTDEALKGQSALVINSLDGFLSGDDVYYFSLWECTSNVQDLSFMKEVLGGYANKKIVFDVQFRLAEDDSLYCSEFCAQVLNKLEGGRFKFIPTNRTLMNPLFEAVLARKNITYFPVDFFQASAFVRKVYEWQRK